MKYKSVFNVALGLIAGMGIGAAGAYKIVTKLNSAQYKKTEKFKQYYYMLNEWLRMKQEGQTLEQYFLGKGYRSVAIYGLGEVGNRLYNELKDSDIDIKYAIDEKSSFFAEGLEIKSIQDNLDNVDAIIVTATFAFKEIAAKLKDKVSCPIISLEDVINEIGIESIL